MRRLFFFLVFQFPLFGFSQETFEVANVRDDIRAAFRSQLKEIRPCLKTLDKEEPGGKILLDFEVDQTGGVRTAKVSQGASTLKKESTQACVLGKIKTWRFPAAPEGRVLEVRYPVVLENTRR